MKRFIELLLRMTLLLLLLLMPTSLSAQDQPNKIYASEDGAVRFTYPSEWTIEAQSVIFDQSYHYELWTHSSELAAYFGNEDRSRILFDIVHPSTAGYPTSLVSPLDYANYALEDQILDYAETKVAGYTAVRAIPVQPAMPPPQTVVVQENFGPVVTATPMPTNPAPHVGRFYAVVRDDGWVVLINMAAPSDEVQSREQEMLHLIESLVFDAKAAATPFERHLETYDFSGVQLTQSYSSTDGNLQFLYPTGWKLDEKRPFNRTMGEPVVMYGVPFLPPHSDAQIALMFMNVTSEGMDLPADLNTSEEYMQSERLSTEGERTQFRVGTFDAVFAVGHGNEGMTELIEFALNRAWVAFGVIEASDRETVNQYEADTAAMLASVRFALGSSFISSPVLNVTLPEEWVLSETEQEEGEYYRFIVRSADNIETMAISIELLNSDKRGLTELTDTNSLKGLLPYLATVQGVPTIHVIGGYEVVRASAIDADMGEFFQYNLLFVNDKWLMVIFGWGHSEATAQATLPCINAIIKEMELALPDA